ncbi:phosphoribosyl-AMP cyclohydrolase [Cryobacterium sp. TMT2-18-3]|uniref:phosphoribosyl-AMP cyclohydrolase n=1 Tax=unclassified Cryobacterium TaxID=2649013 RepID=UPI00106CB0FC|nr:MULTISPECIES: phosphoribosyl-AMP cyclohydrolase [unclassified Cryobacterium]TFC29246.1 phosphoribosyl-AMP cyclohydrolase [Cryobacterium sp. TMT2-18-2]TFC39535.1 phosphoribosyl-AMP cyclohydrolase [Cryobacterium sp. TMT2-42-4]TFC61504.1 phosphoribosyl-AMP cyclohydrolase [Cryobacterium sp. TMT2-18-3]TFC64205.1 phosphoribosyl-AMP cyclohydrolase [Cryobacterium sp. TMT2-15-1]
MTDVLSTLDDALARAVFNSDGLLPAVIQQWDTGEVLMLGWMNREALRRTLTEGRVTFWSRSRQEFWRKGDTSGHGQYVKSAALDCDADTLLVQADQIGAACHTGSRTCFDGRGIEVVTGARPAAPDVAADRATTQKPRD